MKNLETLLFLRDILVLHVVVVIVISLIIQYLKI